MRQFIFLHLIFSYDVWSKEEISVLHWYYEQSKASLDVVGQIVKLFYGKGIEKYRLSVIQHLLQQVCSTNF